MMKRWMMKRWLPRVVLVVAVIGSVGCGVDATDEVATDSSVASVDATDAVAGPNGEVVEVLVLDNSYRPVDVVVSAGTEVVFVNKGRNEHNILPDAVANDAELVELLNSDSSAGSWGVTSEDLPPGTSYSHRFLVPGTYSYYCSIHGVAGKGMYGVVVVE